MVEAEVSEVAMERAVKKASEDVAKKDIEDALEDSEAVTEVEKKASEDATEDSEADMKTVEKKDTEDVTEDSEVDMKKVEKKDMEDLREELEVDSEDAAEAEASKEAMDSKNKFAFNNTRTYAIE